MDNKNLESRKPMWGVTKAAVCAFSQGPRGSIGMCVAYMDVTLPLAHLLWAEDIRLPEDVWSREPSGEGECLRSTGDGGGATSIRWLSTFWAREMGRRRSSELDWMEESNN